MACPALNPDFVLAFTNSLSATRSESGETLLVRARNAETGFDLLTVDLVGDPVVSEAVATPATEVTGTVSRDGRWLAYVSDESGEPEVWVREFGGVGRWRVSDDEESNLSGRTTGENSFFGAASAKI